MSCGPPAGLEVRPSVPPAGSRTNATLAQTCTITPSLTCYARMQLIWADQGDRVVFMDHECPVIPCSASMQRNMCSTDAIEQLGPLKAVFKPSCCFIADATGACRNEPSRPPIGDERACIIARASVTAPSCDGEAAQAAPMNENT